MRAATARPSSTPARTGRRLAQAHRPAATSVTPSRSAETSGDQDEQRARGHEGRVGDVPGAAGGGQVDRHRHEDGRQDRPDAEVPPGLVQHAAVRHQAADQRHDRTREHRVVQLGRLARRGEVRRPPRHGGCRSGTAPAGPRSSRARTGRSRSSPRRRSAPAGRRRAPPPPSRPRAAAPPSPARTAPGRTAWRPSGPPTTASGAGALRVVTVRVTGAARLPARRPLRIVGVLGPRRLGGQGRASAASWSC